MATLFVVGLGPGGASDRTARRAGAQTGGIDLWVIQYMG